MMSAIGALATDAIMPALPQMGAELGAVSDNSRQLTISMLFLGLALGQIFYGPLADSRGRKPAIYLGLLVFIVGSLISCFAQDFNLMLVGRLVQGLGVAAARAIPMALVRDQYVGNRMAQVMSFTQTVFILVPMLAPAYGQAILNLGGWRDIYLSFAIVGALLLMWFGLRQPETLTPENRTPFSWQSFGQALAGILKNREVVGYTLAAGMISGAFLGYLNTAQQLYQELYGLGSQFSLYFALVAVSLGAASLLNSQLVMQRGMHGISLMALKLILVLALIGLGLSALFHGVLPIWLLLTYLMSSFFCVGLLFGNLNALAMQPLGRNAGLGAALVGSLSTLISVPIGTFIGLSYNRTVFPLILGLLVMSALTLLAMRWAGGKGADR